MIVEDLTDNQQDYTWNQWMNHLLSIWNKRDLWDQLTQVVVAVSGGPDSMLLLHVLTAMADRDERLKNGLIVAHVHHGFRGKEADEEALFVERESVKLKLPFEVTQVDTPRLAREAGMNSQAAARKLRYNFFKATARKYEASHIALAHHADDQAETVLMRMVRGTGSIGLSSMAWKRREDELFFIRPLLGQRKREVLHWCKERNISYVMDSSNQERGYLRNRIRIDVIPLLEQENPKVVEGLCRIAEGLRDEDDLLREETYKLFQRHVFPVNDSKLANSKSAQLVPNAQFGYILDRSIFTGLHIALQRRLIKLILNYVTQGSVQIDFKTVDLIREKVVSNRPTTWRMDIAQDVVFVREYDHLLCLRECHEQMEVDYKMSFTIYRTDASGQLLLPRNDSVLLWSVSAANDSSSEHIEGSSANWHHYGYVWEATFDVDELYWPLLVRTRQPGDRIRLQGLSGNKKVQDMFVDLKIAPSLRNTLPLIADANGHIMWIPGIRRSAVAFVKSSTQVVIHFVLEGGAHR